MHDRRFVLYVFPGDIILGCASRIDEIYQVTVKKFPKVRTVDVILYGICVLVLCIRDISFPAFSMQSFVSGTVIFKKNTTRYGKFIKDSGKVF